MFTEREPEEVRLALKQVEAFVTAAFLQPRPVAQGTFELGDLVVLFRVVAKAPAQETLPENGASGAATSALASQTASRTPAKRPARRRRTR